MVHTNMYTQHKGMYVGMAVPANCHSYTIMCTYMCMYVFTNLSCTQMLYKVIEAWSTTLYNPQVVINAVEVSYTLRVIMYVHMYVYTYLLHFAWAHQKRCLCFICHAAQLMYGAVSYVYYQRYRSFCIDNM